MHGFLLTEGKFRALLYRITAYYYNIINMLYFLSRVYVRPSHVLLIEVLRRSLEFTQYTSIAFGLRCRRAGVRPSMGSVGDCFDNAMCESFFATLECELIDRTIFRTHDEARMAIFEYIEGWYNPRRLHSALGYLSPVEYERVAGQMNSSRANHATAISEDTVGLGQVEIAPPTASHKADFIEVQSGVQ